MAHISSPLNSRFVLHHNLIGNYIFRNALKCNAWDCIYATSKYFNNMLGNHEQPLLAGCSHHVLLLFLLLQQWEISLDPGIAGQQVLGGIKNLFPLTAGEQQLVGTLTHSYLKVELFLCVRLLVGQNTQRRKIKHVKCQSPEQQRCNVFSCVILSKSAWMSLLVLT